MNVDGICVVCVQPGMTMWTTVSMEAATHYFLVGARCFFFHFKSPALLRLLLPRCVSIYFVQPAPLKKEKKKRNMEVGEQLNK
jgi:hypothetical protein